ncbi:MAG: hypothetical protein DWQ05_22090 [Calditrichaeota bacterium]|nr:MAG: hypothetical protein DWQ05_22090 [Calditrichota bacterium]
MFTPLFLYPCEGFKPSQGALQFDRNRKAVALREFTRVVQQLLGKLIRLLDHNKILFYHSFSFQSFSKQGFSGAKDYDWQKTTRKPK